MQGVGGSGIDLAARIGELAGTSWRPGRALAVAVSGGPDSLALLLLASAAFGGDVRALTVDHRLREGSAAEAAMVAAVCAGRGIPHATLVWAGDKPAGNRQAGARAARYALMDGWCAANDVPLLLTAHHADDQAETLLLRLARGSGGGGLAGIRARRTLAQGTLLLRPLLGERRTALRAVVDAAGLAAVEDPANRDPRYDRTKARALLAETPWLDAARLAQAAAHLADAAAALDWTEQLAWDSRTAVRPDRVSVDVAGLPHELRRRLALRALAQLGSSGDGPALDRLVARLDAGGIATLGGVQARGGQPWRFRRVPPRLRP